MTQSLKGIKANIIVSATSSITTATSIGGNLLPTGNVTYDIGSSTARWKDIYLSNNTIYLGNTAVSANSILPINLDIAPEVLTINVAAPFPGDDVKWLWNWQTSTLPYARTTIVNSEQVSVPLYKQGTYQLNNFANEQTGSMTQRHEGYLKWIDGAGKQNLVSWAVDAGNVSFSTANINNGNSTVVQRINISVPSVVTLPTLTQPSGISYNVSFANIGAYTISGYAEGDNKTIGPLYRGSTYTFNLASSLANHPFYITTDNGTGFVSGQYIGEYTTGVTGSRNNGTTGKTTLTFTVPQNAPDTLYYQCGVHSMMRGALIIKDLAVETNINGNYVLYFQHTDEGHKTPVEIRPIPSLVNQMCVVYDASVGKFVPQDLATYVENTPSFKNKIREVAGTATLIAPNGVAVVPTVLVVEDVSYLPLVNNKDGDIAFDAYTNSIYVWNINAWYYTKPTSFPAANVVGTVANATYATTSGTAYSVSAANISGTVNLATYATTANSVAGSNVSGTVANATIAGTVYTNAQPNITSIGTLTDLSVSGNTTITGNLTVSGTTTTINSTIVSVNDINIVLANNATSATQANGAGITINGANATMNYISSSNSFVFSHTITTGNLVTSGSGGNISGANNISATTFTGNGSLLTSITGANITGYVPNANIANTAYSVNASNISGTVNLATYATTANSVAGSNVTGYVPNANIANTAYSVAVANVSGIGNIATINKDGNTSNILYGNGVFASAPASSTYGNSNVVTLLSSFGSNTITTTGTLTAGNLVTSGSGGNISGANNISANTFTGNGSLLTSITGANVSGYVPNANIANIAYSVAVANVSGIGNIATVNKDGNASNILYGNGVFAAPAAVSSYGNSNVATFLGSYGSNTIVTTGNVSVGNIIGNGQALTGLTGANITGQVGNALVAGTVYTAAQTNITSVGTLTSLTVTGNITGANLVGNHYGNGSTLTSITGANVTGYVPNSNIANVAYSVAVANVSGIGNIATINLNSNASTVLYGNGVFAAISSGGSPANATVSGTPPVSPTAGSLWYDNATTGELYVYSGTAWVTTSIQPITNVNDPVVSGPTQANEISTQTYTITNYNASFAYVIAVTGGSYVRSGSSISWTMPAVTSNTTNYMTTQVVSGGVTSSIDTRTVLVINLNIDDTAVVVTDFSYNNYNSGWTI
jgi:hypothetical protein